MRIPAALIAPSLLTSALPGHAQQIVNPTVYKVEFDVRNGAEADQSSQHFSLLIYGSRKGTLQAVRRVPVYTGSPEYVDVGANIECTIQESNGKATLRANIELSGITGHIDIGSLEEPIIGQRKTVLDTTVPLGARTLVTDGGNASRPQRIEATVTKVD